MAGAAAKDAVAARAPPRKWLHVVTGSQSRSVSLTKVALPRVGLSSSTTKSKGIVVGEVGSGE